METSEEKTVNMTDENGEFERVDTLPTDCVRCFPARRSQILGRRIATIILIALSISGIFGFTLVRREWLMVAISIVILVPSILVFIHTFLIASYRVALDYAEKKVILRYMFRKITIAFSNFECRDGKPDQADQLLSFAQSRNGPIGYLILDDVGADACYQTTSKDLDGMADFLRLKSEAVMIQAMYRGLPPAPIHEETEDEMDRIIKNATSSDVEKH